MNKFYGIVGYAETVETESPGVWVEKITERNYYGDVIRNTRRWETASGQLNDNLNVNNSISIVADGYAYDHFSEIRYVQWAGELTFTGFSKRFLAQRTYIFSRPNRSN